MKWQGIHKFNKDIFEKKFNETFYDFTIARNQLTTSQII
jgi:hypothetical protein